jgi:hypothetical protein
MDAQPNIVLVHGAWADGSCWSGVIEQLQADESLGVLLSQGPTPPALVHLFTDKQGFGWLSEDDFVNHFAAGVDPARAKVLYAVQQPLAGSTFTDVIGVPAWKSLRTWYLVATQDQAIPPDAERQFADRLGATTIEVAAGHLAAGTGRTRQHQRGTRPRRPRPDRRPPVPPVTGTDQLTGLPRS